MSWTGRKFFKEIGTEDFQNFFSKSVIFLPIVLVLEDRYGEFSELSSSFFYLFVLDRTNFKKWRNGVPPRFDLEPERRSKKWWNAFPPRFDSI